MMVNSLWDVKMVLVFGQESKVRSTWVNGKIIKSGVMVFISGLMGISMRVSGPDLSRMVKVQNLSLTKIFIQVSTRKVNQRVMVSTNGCQGPFLLENLWRE